MKNRLHVVYRISDAGNPKKEKLLNADKISCLSNALQEFSGADFLVIADNCSEELLTRIEGFGVPVVETRVGNIGSFNYALDKSIEYYGANDIVYFCEDDYLHLPGSYAIIIEGIAIADYVTLYDHPDKYIDFADGGDNPLVSCGGEVSRVLLTDSVHWKETNSTPMTFAAKVATLQGDYSKWKRYNMDSYRIWNKILWPKWRYSVLARLVLPFLKWRRLVSPIPSFSTHAELNYLAPLREWKAL